MKKVRLLILFLLYVGVSSVSAQENPKSLLWEISGNGLPQSSYLVGTFHMMCEENFELKDKVKKALKESSKLVTEIDYTNQEEILAMTKLSNAGVPLSKSLTAAQSERLSKALVHYNKTLKDVENLNPQTLYSLIGLKAVPCEPEKIRYYEIELLKLALGAGKKVGGLETVQVQAKALETSYSLDEAIRQLEMGEEYEVLTKEMLEAFKNEDLAKLDANLKDRRFMNLEQEQIMLTDRNQDWAAKMPELMQKEKIMFAVGGGHLWGKKGVIALLKEKGFVVTPVIK